jgi:hypothetical protein
MFQASAIVCAVLSYQIDYDTCIFLNDIWGPFRTEENCLIRANQMVSDVVDGETRSVIFDYYLWTLGVYPDLIYAEGHCAPSDQQEV